MSARDEVLARISTALRDQPATPAVPRDYRTAADPAPADRADLAARLAERVADYSATVHRCQADQVADLVAGTLADRGARQVVAPAGLNPAWLAELPAVLEIVTDEPALSAEALDKVDGVVTTCAAAIAETGTVVLDAGAGQGRRALTLVPDYHLVIVPAARVVAGVPEAIAVLDPRRPLTWISGPSATSDIELDRVEGVHGPRNLEVIVVGSVDE